MGSIVVGYVDSAEGQAAIEAGIAEARRRGVRLVVVHSRARDEGTARSDDLSGVFERIRDRLATGDVDHEIRDLVLGNRPSTDLISAAKEFEAELLVIGIRRRSSTGKLILGSNALEILHDADIPVLCVKATG